MSPTAKPVLVMSGIWVKSVELMKTVVDVLGVPELAPPVLAEEAIKNIRPIALPLVI